MMPDDLYDRDILAWSQQQIRTLGRLDPPQLPWPRTNPFTLNQLLTEDSDGIRLHPSSVSASGNMSA